MSNRCPECGADHDPEETLCVDPVARAEDAEDALLNERGRVKFWERQAQEAEVRVAELEGALETAADNRQRACARWERGSDRVAELEGALRPFLNRWGDCDCDTCKAVRAALSPEEER